jgi:aquaporin Z
MKKYLVEFIGTFFYVLTVVLAANNPNIAPMAPLAIGSMLAVMTYAGSHISGAHFNPAVTLAMLMRGKTEGNEAAVYMIAQILAAVVAAAIGAYLHSCSGEPAIAFHSNHDGFCSGLAEFLGAFAVVYVLFNVSTSDKNAGNSHYGLAIGFTLMAAMFGLGGISGGVFNPAVAIGGAIAGMYAAGDLWIYLVGAFAGAAAAATVFLGVYDTAK